MACSPLITHAGPNALSPDGQHMAVVDGRKAIVYKLPETVVVREMECPQPPSSLAWAPDSNQLLAAMHAQGRVHVWSLSSPAWSARITEHQGMPTVHASFSPDSAAVLLFADFKLRLSVWPLSSSSVRPSFLPFPKHPSPRCFSFTRDAAFFAVLQHLPAAQALPSRLPAHQLRPQVLHRQEASAGGGGRRAMRVQAANGQKGGPQQPQVQIGRDMLVVYDSRSWQPVSSFHLPTEDASDVMWSPDSTCLAVWDHGLTYRLLLVCPDGQPILHLEPEAVGLGLRCAAWMPSAAVLAAGAAADGTIRLISALAGAVTADVEASGWMVDGNMNTRALSLFEECEDHYLLPTGQAMARRTFAHSLIGGPHEVPPALINAGRGKAQPGKHGVGILTWSSDGLFLAARNEAVPSILWVFSATRRGKLKLFSIACLLGSVRCAVWHPTQPYLVMCSGSPCLHVWRSAGSTAALSDASNTGGSGSGSVGGVRCSVVDGGGMEDGVMDVKWMGRSESVLVRHAGGSRCIDVSQVQ